MKIKMFCGTKPLNLTLTQKAINGLLFYFLVSRVILPLKFINLLAEEKFKEKKKYLYDMTMK